MEKLTAPSHLSKEAVTWWDLLMEDYDLQDSAGRLLLATALECFDRMRQAQASIAEHGCTVKDRYEQVKPNPACAIERDAKGQMLASLKALNLDLEPLRDGPGRPGGR